MATQRLPDLPSDEVIRAQPVSELRVHWLLDNYLRERQLTRTTEMLFARVGVLKLKHLPAPDPVGDFGFKAIVSKHSFVDGVDSLLVSAQGWAFGQEDFLLKYFGQTLRETVNGNLGAEVDRDAPTILSSLEDMATELQGRGFTPSAFLITGSVEQQLYRELQASIQNPWSWYQELGVDAGRATHRLAGIHAGVPVVVTEAARASLLYAIDISRFATLIRYGEGPNFDPEFRVKTFSDDEARKVLTRQPNLILDPPPESGREDERIRQLQLRVGLELWETYKLDVKDPGAVIARPLEDFVYE